MNAKLILRNLREERNSLQIDVAGSHHTPFKNIGDTETITSITTSKKTIPHQRTVQIDDCGLGLSIEITEDISGEMRSGNGATLWDSAIILTKYLLVEKNLCGCRVLELGAGVGLPSIALAVGRNTVVATERPIMLPLLEMSIDANRVSHTHMNISTRCLEWDDDEDLEYLAHNFDADVIIGSDLIFPSNEYHWNALAGTFSTLLHGRVEHSDVADSPRRIGYLSYEHRASEVITRFTDLLRVKLINIRRIGQEELAHIDIPTDLHIYELSCA